MKKKLNTDNIMNELKGGSAHFRQAEAVEEETPDTIAPEEEAIAEEPVVEEEKSPVTDAVAEEEEQKVSKTRARRPTRSKPDTSATTSSEQADLIELIRKNVKPVGKEAAFCRFTPEEKSALGDIIYTYKRNGVRTSENEVVRVAVNWLIENYHADGQHSVLAQVLDRLNA